MQPSLAVLIDGVTISIEPATMLSGINANGLRTSIEQHGVINPVLFDSAGKVVDGWHRLLIAAMLGIPCPAKMLDIEGEDATRLRVLLNPDRRRP